MAFDADSGKLSCPSCGQQDNIEQLDEEYITREFAEDEAREYHCENCGAVVLTDQDTTATSCSFCGAGVVLGDRRSEEHTSELQSRGQLVCRTLREKKRTQ